MRNSNRGFNAFITGSHAYGSPTADSDIDLVICLDGTTDDYQVLWDHSDSPISCRFGKLNLIILPPDRFNKWLAVNDDLCSRDHLVTREEAVQAFQAEGFGKDDYGKCSVEVGENQVEPYEDDPDLEYNTKKKSLADYLIEFTKDQECK